MNASRKRRRDENDWDEFQYTRQEIKRRRKTEYCYVVQIRHIKDGNIKQCRWDIINSYSSINEANQCVIQTMREIFKVKSEFDIHLSKYTRRVDHNGLLQFQNIRVPNVAHIIAEIWIGRHEVCVGFIS